MSLRVLVDGVVLSQPMGGVRRHNQELLPRLAHLLAAGGGSLALLEGRDGIPFELGPDIERIQSRVPASPPLVRATMEGRELRALLARRTFDVVHTAHMPVPRGLTGALSVTLHDLRALEGAHTPLSRRLIAGKVIGSALGRAKAVVCVSESVRAQLIERFRVAPDRLHVVPNAADHFAPLPRKPASDAPILCLGHVEPRKNLELVIRALALDPGLPRLVIAGASKGQEPARLRELAEALNVAARVEFLGPFASDALPTLLATAAVLAMPSRLEGFGIPVLEAQRARCPVAVSRIDALMEIAGPTSPCFAPDDPADCARALRAALSADPARIDAAERSAARFAWDDSARRMLEAWRSAARPTG